MLTENHEPGLHICNHERSHFGLDAAYCPDCKRQFCPRSKEYQQLLHQPLVLNHPDPRPGDRVSLLGDRPSRIYEILKVDGGHAICKPIDGEGTRKAAYWKLRAYCSAEQVSSDCSKALTPDTSLPDPVSGVDAVEVTPDTPLPDPVSGVDASDCFKALTPDTSLPDPVSGVDTVEVTPDTPLEKHSHWVEVYRPNKRRTEYHRYVWMIGQKMNHRHIPGGNIKDAKAQSAARAVESAIATGKSPTAILELIRLFRSGTQHQER